MEYFTVSKKPEMVWVTGKDVNNTWISSEYYNPVFLDIEKKFLDRKFDIYKFNEIADINRVAGFEVEKYLEIVDKGIPYLRVKNISECFIDFNDMYYIPQHVHRQFKKSQFKKDDIAMTITGRVGTAAIINDESIEYNASQDVVKISIKRKYIDPYYMTIYLNSKINHSLLNRFNSGGSRQRTLINNVREIKIPIPPSEIQKYIGDKVREAEKLREKAEFEKNELNNKFLNLIGIDEKAKYEDEKFRWAINSELTAISIIPEFYKTKYLQNEEKISGGKFKCEKIKDICKFIDEGSTPASKHPKEYYSKGELFIRGGNIDRNFIDFNKVARITKKDYKMLPKGPFGGGDVLLTMRGNFGYSVVVPENIKEFKINPTIAVLRPKDYVNKYYLAAYLNSTICRVQMDRLGQTSTRPQLNLSEVKTIKVIIPPMDIQKYIESKVKDYINKEQASKQLIQEVKQDVEDLIEGNFDMSKLN